MRWNYRGDQFYLTDDEIERSMEEKLIDAGLMPSVDQPVVDLESLIEDHLGVSLDQHAELDENLLGETEFIRGESPRININRDLTGVAEDEGDVGQVGRWRATIAHEASHVILHRILYEFADDQGILFPKPEGDGASPRRLMRCLKRDFGTLAARDWKEIQANKGMAALLMPRAVFVELAGEELEALRIGPRRADRNDRRVYAVACALAQRFRASRQAVLIRLETQGLIARPGQTGLAM